MTRSVVAIIDPYWLLGRVASPEDGMLRTVAKAAGSDAWLVRVHGYIETDNGINPAGLMPRVTLRSAPRDDLDDGCELVRAMEADIRSLADNRTFDELLEIRFEALAAPDEPVTDQTRQVIENAVVQRHREADPVDSRMLFLTSQFLARELSESERIMLRQSFKSGFRRIS